MGRSAQPTSACMRMCRTLAAAHACRDNGYGGDLVGARIWRPRRAARCRPPAGWSAVHPAQQSYRITVSEIALSRAAMHAYRAGLAILAIASATSVHAQAPAPEQGKILSVNGRVEHTRAQQEQWNAARVFHPLLTAERVR